MRSPFGSRHRCELCFAGVLGVSAPNHVRPGRPHQQHEFPNRAFWDWMRHVPSRSRGWGCVSACWNGEMFVYQPTSKGTISRLKRFPPDCRSWGSGEMCSLLVSRQLGKAGPPSVRGDTRDGGKGLHEVRSLKSTRTTGTARMAAFVASCCHLRLWSHVLDCICYNDSGTSVSASCKQMALLTLEHVTMTGKLSLVFGPRSTPVQFPRASTIRKNASRSFFPYTYASCVCG